MLRLYLEDTSRFIYFIMQMSLQDAHRALIEYLSRSMTGLAETERRGLALRLCKLRGLVRERIDEASSAGEAPLVRAAADGGVGPSALGLLIAAGAAVDGQALRAAAQHGNMEALCVLIEGKAPVDAADQAIAASADQQKIYTYMQNICTRRCINTHMYLRIYILGCLRT